MSPGDPRPLLRIGHSPDPDDAFMWWPLEGGPDGPSAIDTGRFRYEAVLDDIEVLNQRSQRADLELTALSCAQYPHVCDRYAITACGASLGDGYGPKLVAREPMDVQTLRGRAGRAPETFVVAVPGERTSAFGALSLMLGVGMFRHAVVPFDRIIELVADGSFDAGLVIHEGQLTYEAAGLHLVVDIGAWWHEKHGLPMPLGINAVRRDLEDAHGPGTLAEITATLKRSVEHALVHRDQSIVHALAHARGMGAELADAFVSLYVNAWTLDFGDDGRAGVRVFLDELRRAGIVPDFGSVAFVSPAGA